MPSGSVYDGNYGGNYAVDYVSNNGSITQLAITVSAAYASKVYDGTTTTATTPTITGGGLVYGDTAAFTESFAGKNATGETLTAAGSVNDGSGGSNYAVTFGTPVTTGQITARAITVTAITSTKVYDGTTSSTAVPTITGGVGTGDTAAFTETYGTKKVGTGKTLTAAGSVNDGNGGSNYAVTFGTPATTGQITARPITVTAITSTKVYDGTTSSTVTPMITGDSVVTTLAGCAGQQGSSDGTGSAARFDYPSGVAVDSAGNVYVADMTNDEIREITASGVVTTLAGSPGQAGSSNGTGSAARFDEPCGVAVDSAGNVYVADAFNDEIREITPSGVVTTLAGSPGQTGSSNGTGSAASFYCPTGVAVDAAGNVYVADEGNSDIREITPSGVVTTLAGSAGRYGSNDGTGSAASFYYPAGVAVDAAGDVYVADCGNGEIREIAPSGVVNTLAGSPGQTGSSDGTGSAASFYYPTGVAVDAAGNVYVADEGNDEIRLVSGNLAPGDLAPGDTAAFTETYNTQNVGTDITLTPAGSVNDGNGGANYVVSLISSTTGTIIPAASISGPSTVNEGDVYTLGLSAAFSSDDAVSQWQVNWGDGQVQTVERRPVVGQPCLCGRRPVRDYSLGDRQLRHVCGPGSGQRPGQRRAPRADGGR